MKLSPDTAHIMTGTSDLDDILDSKPAGGCVGQRMAAGCERHGRDAGIMVILGNVGIPEVVGTVILVEMMTCLSGVPGLKRK
jgi:hypothetical protein